MTPSAQDSPHISNCFPNTTNNKLITALNKFHKYYKLAFPSTHDLQMSPDSATGIPIPQNSNHPTTTAKLQTEPEMQDRKQEDTHEPTDEESTDLFYKIFDEAY